MFWWFLLAYFMLALLNTAWGEEAMTEAIASCVWRALPVKWKTDDVLHGSTASEKRDSSIMLLAFSRLPVWFWASLTGAKLSYLLGRQVSFASPWASFYPPAKWHRWCSGVNRSAFSSVYGETLWATSLGTFSGRFGEAGVTAVFNALGHLKAGGRLNDLAIVAEQARL